ncbi:MAG: PAS domain S-box protein, partial [Candidatus Thorarchaeota archaeon]
GTIIPIDNYGRTISIQDEKVIAVITIDRSEQVSTEKALDESEKKYKSLFEHAPTGLAITNEEGEFLAANNALLSDTLYTQEDLKEIKASVMYENPQDRKQYLSIMKEKGTVKDYEMNMRRKDGTTFPALLNADPISFNGVSVFLTSIRNLSALKESQETNRNIVHSLPIGLHMYELNDDDSLVFIGGNPAADTTLGVDNKQFIGKTIEEAFPPLSDTEVPIRYREAAENGIPWTTEQIEYSDEKISGAFEVHAFQTSSGKMAAAFMDITNRLNAKLELERAKRKAEFYTDLMAHDMNNIHQGILIGLELTSKLQDLPPRAGDLIKTALEQTRRGIRLISNVRKLTSVEVSDQENVKRLDICEIIDEIIPIVKFSFPEKEIDFKCDMPDDKFIVEADDLIGDVFYNLCHNSAKFSQRNMVEIDIRGKYSEDGKYAEITIEDNGPGIPNERKHEVLSRKVGKSTTGLGLILVNDIIRKYHGSIWIEDRVPNDSSAGVRFVIRLPMCI